MTTSTLAEGKLLAAAAGSQTGRRRAKVALTWLGAEPPLLSGGVSWGVPWPQRAVAHGAGFSLSADGKDLPVQSWPLAFWPDGSLKWSGFATVVPAGLAGPVILSTGSSAASGTLKVTNNGKSVLVDTGALQCSIPATGGMNLVESMTVEGRTVVGAGQLVCILQNGPEGEPGEVRPQEKFVSLVKKVTVEQTGPVRAVVKFEGVHKGAMSGREWLPFHVRLYFYSGETIGAHGAYDLLRWRPGEGFHSRAGRHVRRAYAGGDPEPPCAFLRGRATACGRSRSSR